VAPELSFDLVVATVGRVAEPDRLLDSLERQVHRRFRVILVDQNDDDRLERVIAAHAAVEVTHLRSERGLSRARNTALPALTGEIVAFPDDDCEYAHDVLERVAGRLAEARPLDGISGRSVARDGRSSASWERDGALLTDDNLWNRVNSGAIFLRRDLVARVGEFDESLGLGSGNPWASGEEIDYLVRAVRAGARIEYDPSVVVTHDVVADDSRIGLRDGASVGYLLRKHAYPARTLARMLVRPVGGVVVSLARRDSTRARYYAATVRGRVLGYRGARRAKTSA
jgi:glycosyltransferase involved in cell wall biosynthesis